MINVTASHCHSSINIPEHPIMSCFCYIYIHLNVVSVHLLLSVSLLKGDILKMRTSKKEKKQEKVTFTSKDWDYKKTLGPFTKFFFF